MDLSIIHVSILGGLFEKCDEPFIVLLERVELDLKGTVSLARAVQVLHGLLEVSNLLA